MLISLAKLTDAGLKFEHQYASAELTPDNHDFIFTRWPRITGRVDRAGHDMRLRGQVSAQLELGCDRCAESVLIEIDTPFDLFYTPREDESDKADEVELQIRDLDFSVYENEEINLDDLVMEQLELSLPLRVLCQENCQGLCPQCGTNFNVTTCQCQVQAKPGWRVTFVEEKEKKKKKS
jgi:uncharacterized metal-binding protein YceD (DUF177 family)